VSKSIFDAVVYDPYGVRVVAHGRMTRTQFVVNNTKYRLSDGSMIGADKWLRSSVLDFDHELTSTEVKERHLKLAAEVVAKNEESYQDYLKSGEEERAAKRHADEVARAETAVSEAALAWEALQDSPELVETMIKAEEILVGQILILKVLKQKQ